MLQFIFWSIVFYLLFRFIFNFVVPMVRVGRQMRRQMKQFNENIRNQQEANASFTQSNAGQQPRNDRPKANSEDYIEFEEIK